MTTIIPIRARGPLMNAHQLRDALRRVMIDTVAEGKRFMAEYPPAAPGQRYKRTGTLKRSWSGRTVNSTNNKSEGIVGSNSGVAPYNSKVQGPEAEQGPYFRGLWQNVDDLVAKTKDELPRRVQAEIDRAAG